MHEMSTFREPCVQLAAKIALRLPPTRSLTAIQEYSAVVRSGLPLFLPMVVLGVRRPGRHRPPSLAQPELPA